MFFVYLLFIATTVAQVGICGVTELDCTWEYDNATKTLDISGSGNMNDFEVNGRPWEEILDEIINLNINGLKTIGKNAFYGSSSLKNIHFSDSIEKIGEKAFAECKSIGFFVVTKNVVEIGPSVLENCVNLRTVIFGKEQQIIPKRICYGCSNLEIVIFQNKVVEIQESAFENCSKMYMITYSNVLKTIGKKAFYNTGIEYLDYNEPLTSIDDYAFANCSKLERVVLNNTQTLGNGAFSNCTNLKIFRYNSKTKPQCEKTVFENDQDLTIFLTFGDREDFCGIEPKLLYTDGEKALFVILIFVCSMIIFLALLFTFLYIYYSKAHSKNEKICSASPIGFCKWLGEKLCCKNNQGHYDSMPDY